MVGLRFDPGSVGLHEPRPLPWPAPNPQFSFLTVSSALKYGSFPPSLITLGLKLPASNSLSPGPADSHPAASNPTDFDPLEAKASLGDN